MLAEGNVKVNLLKDRVVAQPLKDRVGGAAAEGPAGGVVVRGPQGDVHTGRAVGDRVAFLPDSATPLIVNDQTYFVDDSGVYYLLCSDDNTSFCVVPNPQ